MKTLSFCIDCILVVLMLTFAWQRNWIGIAALITGLFMGALQVHIKNDLNKTL